METLLQHQEEDRCRATDNDTAAAQRHGHVKRTRARRAKHTFRAAFSSSLSLFGVCAVFIFLQTGPAFGSAYDFLRLTAPHTFFAVDPDLTIRTIDPTAPSKLWTLGEGWGFPPLYFHTKVPGYDRVDFFYPFGCREESAFFSKLRFTPLLESRWSKIPPFDGYSRCLTLFQGRSDLGQDYWGVFPFYGYSYRRRGVDRDFFFMFPLYYESHDDDVETIRLLWPFITYADSPGRSSFKVWPLFGKDAIRQDYFNWYVLWPFFQKTVKYPGTEQAAAYCALPFPLYVHQETAYSSTTDIIWPLITYYHHYPTGHQRYSFRPFLTYGTGGGVEELSIFFFYSSKKDRRKGTETGTGSGYVSVGDDDIFTERKFLLINTIQKRYRKGFLVYSRYRFWPFAEYTWDLEKGSHFKFPEVISLKNDWWDLNLGRLLRFVDFRDTPITRELNLLFGLSGRTDIKKFPHISRPPKPGEDNWTELITGAFGKR